MSRVDRMLMPTGWSLRCGAVIAAVFLLAGAPRAQDSTIRLATVVPEGSIWDRSLRQMGADWSAATGGRVSVTVFSGGSQGDEATVLRKMRLNTLQAASLTNVGLSAIDPVFNVFGIPFFFDSYEELNAVVDALAPTLRDRLHGKGFVVVNWGHGGFLQVFSRSPVKTLADLKKVNLYTSAGDDQMTQWYKANGFRPRAMAMTDILTGLTTGMIDALPAPPLAALAFQWSRQAPYMLEIALAPVVGATVVTERAWRGVPEAERPGLIAAASKVEALLDAEVPKQEAFAVGLMQTGGLTITKAEGPEWHVEAAKLAQSMRGGMVPADIFDMAVKARDVFRQGQLSGTAR